MARSPIASHPERYECWRPGRARWSPARSRRPGPELGLGIEEKREVLARLHRDHLTGDRASLRERLEHGGLDRSIFGTSPEDVEPPLILAANDRHVPEGATGRFRAALLRGHARVCHQTRPPRDSSLCLAGAEPQGSVGGAITSAAGAPRPATRGTPPGRPARRWERYSGLNDAAGTPGVSSSLIPWL